jgi:hypothetical protein
VDSKYEVDGEGRVLASQSKCFGWVYERIFGGVGGSFVVILDLRCEIDSRLDFVMIFGVGIRPLRKSFQFYLVLLA